MDWLIYHPAHHVLVCKIHGYSLSDLGSHLAEKHGDIDLPSRKAIARSHAHLDLCRPPGTCPAAQQTHNYSPIRAVDGLKIHDGLACLECGFLSISRKRLKVHCKEEHGWSMSKADPKHWSRVTLQTLFAGSGAMVEYFRVTVAAGAYGERAESEELCSAGARRGSGGSKRGLVDEIKAQWAAGKERQDKLQTIAVEGASRHETTNWLRRTGWATHFKDKELSEIWALGKMPGKEDDELRRICAATDRLFFGRCVNGLKSMPLMTRLLLASPHQHSAHSRPFGPLQEKTSMDRYMTYWKRFLCYCLGALHMDEAELLRRHGFSCSGGQRRGLESLWAHACDRKWLDEALEEELLQVSAAFWTQRLEGDPFTSPLWHFVGVLGIDGKSGQFRPAHLFTYVLAGLVYVGRALLGEYAIPASKRGAMDDLGARFAQVRNAWLCKATYSPMGYILSLLLYGRKIALETGSRLMVSWSKQGELMFFMGKPVVMDDVREMVAEMTANAEELLWNSLMFKEGSDSRFTISLADIEDDLTHTQRGKSFVHSNGLAGKEAEMLEDLVGGRRRREFLDTNGEWKWAGIQKYLAAAAKFEELLLLLVHFTGGQPSRGEEITGLRLVNGINRDRNVFVIDGEVVLVTQYWHW